MAATPAPKPGQPIKLNKSNIDAITLPGVYPDADLTGFRLRVGASGVKSYQVAGKVKGLPQAVFVTIGKHGDPWTPSTARDEAERLRHLMRQGVNPNNQAKERRAEAEAARQKEAAQKTLESLTLRLGFEKHLEKGQKASTVRGYKKVVNAHLKDWLDKPLTSITQADVIKRFDKIHQKSPSHAALAMRLLRAIFNTVQITYGESVPEVAALNPVKILRHGRKDWNTIEPRQDYIQDEDLPAFYKAVMGLQNTTAQDYLMVCVLTGLRKGEACKLRWDENIDLKRKAITISDTKNKQRHMLAMSDYLYELFLRRWQTRDSEWVFPGKTRSGHYDDPKRSITRAIEAAEIDRFSSHSLRRTFATAADAVGYDLRSIQRLLNHKPGSVADRHYIQRHAEKTREPMQRITDHLLKLMKADRTGPVENVVPLQANKAAR